MNAGTGIEFKSKTLTEITFSCFVKIHIILLLIRYLKRQVSHTSGACDTQSTGGLLEWHGLSIRSECQAALPSEGAEHHTVLCLR